MTATFIGVAIVPSIGVMTGVAKIYTDQVGGIGRVTGEDRGTEMWAETVVEGAEIGITGKGEATPAIKLEDGATILLTQSGGADGKTPKITKGLVQMV